MTLRRYNRIQAVLAKRQPDLTILAENVYKPHNLSAMLRTCDAVGIAKAHAINPTGGLPTFNETSGSADKWVELLVHKTLAEGLEIARAQDMQIYAAHLSDQAVDYRDVNYVNPTCILLGNERAGVTEEAAAAVDAHIIIPMLGMVESLNVSVATAVILFEAQRQRRAAGLYDTPRYTPDTINEQAFRWLYPREAQQLEMRGLPFPEILEENLLEVEAHEDGLR